MNFAGEYQAKAHKYTEELFGEEYVYRAGTIGTIKDKPPMVLLKSILKRRGLMSALLK